MTSHTAEFACDVRSYARDWFVGVAGELDLDGAPYLDAILRLCGGEVASVAIDCRELEFIDSAGIGVLLRGRRTAAELGHAFTLAGLLPQARRVLELCGLGDAFEMREHMPLIADAVAQAYAVIATDLNGVVTHWNAAAHALYGWSEEEVTGLPITSLTVGPGDETLANEIMERVRERGVWEGDFEVTRRDGTTFRAHVRDTLVLDFQRRPVGLLGISIPAVVPATSRR